jgi:hypothetical protein
MWLWDFLNIPVNPANTHPLPKRKWYSGGSKKHFSSIKDHDWLHNLRR